MPHGAGKTRKGILCCQLKCANENVCKMIESDGQSKSPCVLPDQTLLFAICIPLLFPTHMVVDSDL